MKRIVVFFCFFFFSFNLLSSEVRWFQEGYKKALKNAEKSNKVLMIDFYTDWCAVCQYMDKKIYNDDKFIEELTKLPIIPLKLNAERDGDGKVLSSSFKIKFFPTVLFIDGMGREIGRIIGFREREAFLDSIKKILEEKIPLDLLKKRYEEDREDLINAFNYAKRLYSMGEEEALKLLEEIYNKDKENKLKVGAQSLAILTFDKIEKIQDQMNYFSIFRYDPMVDDLKIGEDKELKFTDLFLSIGHLLKGWIVSNSPILEKYLEDSYEKLKEYGEKYDWPSNLKIYLSAFELKEWGKVPLLLADILEMVNDPEIMNEVAWLNYKYQRKLEASLELSKRSCEMMKKSKFLDTQAHLLMALGRKEEALAVEKLAIEEAKKMNEMNKVKNYEKNLKNFEENRIGYVMDFVEIANKELKKAQNLEEE